MTVYHSFRIFWLQNDYFSWFAKFQKYGIYVLEILVFVININHNDLLNNNLILYNKYYFIRSVIECMFATLVY